MALTAEDARWLKVLLAVGSKFEAKVRRTHASSLFNSPIVRRIDAAINRALGDLPAEPEPPPTVAEDDSCEADLRRVMSTCGDKRATDAARRAVHVLVEQERQIKVLREDLRTARAERRRDGTVTAVLAKKDAEELRGYIKEVVLEVDEQGVPRPASRRGMEPEDDAYWMRIDAALNAALGDPDNDYSGDDPYCPTRGGMPSEHDLREAQKLK